MTKQQLIYLCMTQLAQGDLAPRAKKVVHQGDIERHLEMAFSDIVREVYNNATTYKDYGQLDAMSKTFKDVAVVVDPTRGEYYSELPVSVLQLPLHAGIRMIVTQCDQEQEVLWRGNNNIGILNELDVYSTGKPMPTYYVEHTKVFYDKLKADHVMMKIVPTFSAYDDDDEIPVVSGYEGWVYDMVIQRYTQGGARRDKVRKEGE